MVLLERPRAPDIDAADVARLQRGDAVAERRRAEPRHACRVRQPGNLPRVVERRRQWFVDEQWLAASNDLSCLREMYAPVDARQQYAVDPRTQVGNAADDGDAVFVAQLRGEVVDAIAARRQIRTSAGIRGDDPRARDVLRRSRIVERGGERRHMRAVGP